MDNKQTEEITILKIRIVKLKEFLEQLKEDKFSNNTAVSRKQVIDKFLDSESSD